MDNNEIIRRQKALESERQTIEDTWDVIEQFVAPYRGEFFRDNKSEFEIDWRQRQLFDSTAVMAATILASSIHGSLTSPAIRWFDLRFRKDELNMNNDAKRWIEEVQQRVYYALQDSNFNLEASETYLDLVTMGTSVIIEENEGDEIEGDVDIVFKSIPVKEAYFEQDHKGNVYGLYRKLQWTPQQIKSKFGNKVPAWINEKCENTSSSNDKIEIIFAIYRRKGMENADTLGVLTPEMRPFGYKYIIQKSGETLGDEGGYYEMPSFVPRWRKTSESKWGNSPAMIALPDILTVNQLVELILRAAEKVVDPATLVTERGLLSDLDLEPGGLSVVRTLDDLRSHESKARFDVSELQREKLRDSINRIFMVDQLELKQSPAMTATEVQVRYELMQRLLGPTLGRLQSDFLNPLIERTFRILWRAGNLPELPDVLREEGADLDIQYTGPLTRAQKSDVAVAAERWMQNIAGMAEFKPEILDLIDADEIARDLADTLNVPAKYVKSKEKVNSERKARQEQQQVAAEAQQAQEVGMAMKAVGDGAAAIQENGNG